METEKNGYFEEIDGISLVIPAYNESLGILDTLNEANNILSRVDYPSEIVVVDDGSADETAVLAKEVGAKVIVHPINSGYGRSLRTGIEIASYNTIVIIDADGTYPFEEFPDLLMRYESGLDMVVGARQGSHYRGSLTKGVLRTFFRYLVEFTCGRPIPDINSGFRIFNRSKACSLSRSFSSGFSFTTTITLLFMLHHYFVAYQPIAYRERHGKSKVRMLPDSLRSLQIIVTTIAQYNPLKLYLLQFGVWLVGNIFLAVLYFFLSALDVFYLHALLVGWNSFHIISALCIIALILIKSDMIKTDVQSGTQFPPSSSDPKSSSGLSGGETGHS